ncbi:MAG TPA: hypothetical protein VH021_01505 [Trebonia sp.]|nr:hypothetical protein [Trebonia sp.]
MTNMWEGLGPDHTPTAPHQAAGPGGGRRRRWTAGLLIAAVAAGGGAFAVAEATGAPAASTPIALSASSASPASSAGQDAAIQVAALNAELRGRGGRGGLARLRRLGGMYGQFTAETKKGARTLAFERGTITSAAGGAVTVRAHDGTTWVWKLTGTSVVRDDGKAATASALSAGEPVFVGGPVAGGTRDARLIVIRKAASGAA